VPFPVRYRKSNPYENLRALVEPGHDPFAVEAEAVAITARWSRLLETGSVRLADGFYGSTPMPARYKDVGGHAFAAEFDGTDHEFETGLRKWIAQLGKVHSVRFFYTP
jgi:hypothetical protein